MRSVKPFYTLLELATLFGLSRWAMRRWLDNHRIPYECVKRPGARRSAPIHILRSDIRTYAPKYFASLQEDSAIAFDEAS